MEVWHMATSFKRVQGQIPPIIKYITDQILARSIRMNNLIVQLTTQKKKKHSTVKVPTSRKVEGQQKLILSYTLWTLQKGPKTLTSFATQFDRGRQQMDFQTLMSAYLAAKETYQPGDIIIEEKLGLCDS